MKEKLIELLAGMQEKHILVLGDMVADVYLEGKIARISREAPVLVLEYAGEKVVPGGAANVVLNAAVLGGLVYAVGVIGADDKGRELKRCLQAQKVNTAGLIGGRKAINDYENADYGGSEGNRAPADCPR